MEVSNWEDDSTTNWNEESTFANWTIESLETTKQYTSPSLSDSEKVVTEESDTELENYQELSETPDDITKISFPDSKTSTDKE